MVHRSSVTLACCLNKELAEIVKREYSNTKSSRLLFSPSWESAKLHLKNNFADQVIVPSTISEAVLQELASSTNAQTTFIILGTRSSAQKLVRGTSGFFFRQRQPYELIEARIKSLSADVRNDLNNPLQEIVALAYVAKESLALDANSSPVFAALESAALRMNGVVSSVEKRIVSDLITH